jgi:catechol 2,3-dioxygenase-like lactoylglutathione lyase family enzyme
VTGWSGVALWSGSGVAVPKCRRSGLGPVTVGLSLSPETIKNHLLFDCGNGTTLLIYGRGNGNSADHTQVRFWTSGIDQDVAELVGRGIEFEEYDMGAFKTIDHVVTSPGIGRSAWFKDPDGNTIAIFQPE